MRSELNTSNCPDGLNRSVEYLLRAFQELGCATTRQEFPVDGITCANVEALPPGFLDYQNPHIILGAHHKSALGIVGADGFMGTFVGRLPNDQKRRFHNGNPTHPPFRSPCLLRSGYPAIMLTNMALCRNTYYHRPSDTSEMLNYPTMAPLTKRIAVAVETLAR